MNPFKVYDRRTKTTWIILNYHASQEGGEYLAVREDDSAKDGEISLIKIEEICKLKWVDFWQKVET